MNETKLLKEIYRICMQTTQNFEEGHKRVMLLLHKHYQVKKKRRRKNKKRWIW